MVCISFIAKIIPIRNDQNEIVNYYQQIKSMTLPEEITDFAYPQSKRSLKPNTTYPGIKQDLLTLFNKKINQNKINAFPQPIAALSRNHLDEMKDNLPTVLRFLHSKALKSEMTSPTKLIIYNIDHDQDVAKTIYETLKPVVFNYSMTRG